MRRHQSGPEEACTFHHLAAAGFTAAEIEAYRDEPAPSCRVAPAVVLAAPPGRMEGEQLVKAPAPSAAESPRRSPGKPGHGHDRHHPRSHRHGRRLLYLRADDHGCLRRPARRGSAHNGRPVGGRTFGPRGAAPADQRRGLEPRPRRHAHGRRNRTLRRRLCLRRLSVRLVARQPLPLSRSVA